MLPNHVLSLKKKKKKKLVFWKFNQGSRNQIKLMTEFWTEGHELPPLGSSELSQTFLDSVHRVFLLGFLVPSSDSTGPPSILLMDSFFLLLVWSVLLEIKRTLTHPM